METIQGLKTYASEVDLHGKIRANFIQKFRSAGTQPGSIVILQGSQAMTLWDTDNQFNFRQQSYFFYLFGADETDLVGILQLDTGKVHLLVPHLSQNLALYLVIPTPNLLKEKYGVQTGYLEQLSSLLSTINPSKIYLNLGTSSDSSKSTQSFSYFQHQALSAYTVDSDTLYPILTQCRVIKLPQQIQILKRVAQAASKAHIEMMKNCKPGMMENQLQAIFTHFILYNYGQLLSFTPIAGSGKNGSVLHYPFNSSVMEDGTLVVLDMGSYGLGYCSDITCTLPVNGVYTQKQKEIYQLVLNANRAVFSAAKPGVNWTDMHILAERTILEGLVRIGLLVGDVDQMVEKRVGGVFMPHGLGHFLGLDVHDVGGYVKGPERANQRGLRNLRTRRDLEVGMVITIEPGCYFIDFALDSALNDPEIEGFFVKEKVDQYRGFGGVRLEDDVVITETGAELLNRVPRDPDEVEAVMRGE